jgi:penicillin amidase
MRVGRILKFAGVVLLCGGALAGGGYMWLRSSGLPLRSGRATVIGLGGEVLVRFDEWGVPHVQAQNKRDAAAAMGWLHANDRMFQLELGRRSAFGRLSEVLGSRTLPMDRQARTLRQREMAERWWEACGKETRDLLEAYAAGVNSWLGNRKGDLPSELRALGVTPEPWTPIDSLGFAVLLARDLSYPVWNDDRHFQYLIGAGHARLENLMGTAIALHPGTEALAEEVQPRLAIYVDTTRPSASTASDDAEGAPGRQGSNSWALGSDHTATGAPIVANDPHLSLGFPSLWYQAQLRSPGYEAAGMTVPGLPLIVIGQGPHVAWSFTNTELDTNDLFFEQLNEAGTHVRRGSEWVAIESRRETIGVRFGDDVVLDLQATEIGPLLPPGGFPGVDHRSLAWTAYEPFDPLAAFLGLARATSVDDVPNAIAGFVCPVQNVVCADRDGGLLCAMLGRVPDRAFGEGRLPLDASETALHWRGLRSAASNPLVRAGPEGVLVTANDDIRPEGYALALPAYFAGGWRAQRIRKLCESRDGWWPAEVAEMQIDDLSTYARAVVALLPDTWTGEAAAARDALRSWDGRMDVRGGGALFALFERRLLALLFDDDRRLVLGRGLPHPAYSTVVVRALSGELDASWVDDLDTQDVEETIDEVAERALIAAWREGRERWGIDPFAWPYGEIHTWQPRHPLGEIPGLTGVLDRGPFPVAGSSTTINALSGDWGPDGMEVSHGPSMRFVADTANPDNSLAVLPTGQSGHPFDEHYDDQMSLFRAGRTHAVHWSEESISTATVSTLILHP